MMMVTMLFTWHNATIFVIMSLAGSLVYLRVKAKGPAAMYRGLHGPLRMAKMDAEQIKNMIVDSEEEEV